MPPASSRLLIVVVCALLNGGCGLLNDVWPSYGTDPHRALVDIDAEWRDGVYEEDSLSTLRDAVEALGRSPLEGRGGDGLPDLCRLALDSPSALVRADALRAAWKLARQLPPEPWRVDDIDVVAFNERARQLAELLDDDETARTPEAAELAAWLAAHRFPLDRAAEGITLAGAVASQASFWEGELGAAFETGLDGCLRHAAVLATFAAALDESDLVREEALRHAPLCDKAVSLPLLANAVARETDTLLLITALDALHTLAPELSRGELERAVSLVPPGPDPAVRRALEMLLAERAAADGSAAVGGAAP